MAKTRHQKGQQYRQAQTSHEPVIGVVRLEALRPVGIAMVGVAAMLTQAADPRMVYTSLNKSLMHCDAIQAGFGCAAVFGDCRALRAFAVTSALLDPRE
jgi:hypothetical protein